MEDTYKEKKVFQVEVTCCELSFAIIKQFWSLLRFLITVGYLATLESDIWVLS